VRSAAYNGDGSRIVSAGANGSLLQWDATTGRAIGEPLEVHQGFMNSAAFSRDGSRIVSAGDDGTVRQWDAKSGRLIGEIQASYWSISSAVYSPDDGMVRQWDAKTGRAIGERLWPGADSKIDICTAEIFSCY
jgi:WD40 repeat protein